MMVDILTTILLIAGSFSLGAMGANASHDTTVSKAKGEAYTDGYKEGYKNAMSYMLTSLILATGSAKNSDS